MGYSFREDLSAEGCIEALQMALKQRRNESSGLVHHSDRGVQYCSRDYVDILIKANVTISMTENGDPYENALAERINGILKTEFRLYSSPCGFEQTKAQIDQSIHAYNTLRPHSSCDYLTPQQAHQQTGKLKKRWKYYRKAHQQQKIDTFETTGPV
jgi:transposase InsO family protein